MQDGNEEELKRMMEEAGVGFFELSAFETPLQRFIDLVRDRPGGEPALEILETARALAVQENPVLAGDEIELREKAVDLHQERERARREVMATPALLEELLGLAEQAGEEMRVEQYVLTELVQAAAVGSAGLAFRTRASGLLAVAARLEGRIERARAAYADALEGIRILTDLLQGDRGALANLEATMREGWASVQERAPGPTGILDPSSPDPAAEWVELVVWNTDLGSGQGLLAQVDATLRLGLRLEHWIDRLGERPDSVVGRMREVFAERARDDEDGWLLEARLLVTLGDALMEVGEWGLAAEVHSAVLGLGDESPHPVGYHAAVQEAYCHLMLDDVAGCRRRLDAVDRERLDAMAELVITIAAEAARWHALDALVRRREGRAREGETGRERAAELVRRVALIASRDLVDRTQYLRTLFFALTARDVESMLTSE